MEWERGETPPGRVMSNLKTGGLRDLLEDLAREAASAGGAAPSEEVPTAAAPSTGAPSTEAPSTEAPSTEAWKPVV